MSERHDEHLGTETTEPAEPRPDERIASIGRQPADDRHGPPPPTLPGAPTGTGPRAIVKRVIGKLTRWELAPILSRVDDLGATKVDRTRHDEDLAALRAALDVIREQIEDRKRWTIDQLDDVRRAVALQEQLRGQDRAQLGAELSLLRSSPANSVLSEPAHDESVAADSLAALYETHQARFRGSREMVRARQEVFLPHVRTVATDDAPVLDIGPGRGEWLELLRQHGIQAYGVDVNRSFVDSARAMGLDVRLEEGLAHLRRLPDVSLSAVTAFHVVEHMPAESLVDLVDQCLRVLRPGGVLMVETPNPVNLTVGASSFHLDPTHVRPVHPLFLQFVLESRGFVQLETVMLHPPDEPALEVSPDDHETVRRAAVLINQHFFTGMDYAILGHRASAVTQEGGNAGDASEQPTVGRTGAS